MPDSNVLNRADPLVLYHTMMGMIYDRLTGGDSEILKDKGHFFTWQSVGIPVDPAEWDFMSGRLTSPSELQLRREEPEPVDPEAARANGSATADGSVAADGTDAGPDATDPDSDGERMRFFLHNAEMFAANVDFVPDLSGQLDMDERQEMLHTQTLGATLTGEYERILDECMLARDVITDEAAAQIEKITSMLTVTGVVKDEAGAPVLDPITDEPITVTQPSTIVKAYNEHMAKYHLAWTNLNNLRVEAQGSNDPVAIARASVQIPIEEQKVHVARQLWESAGFRSRVEGWRAELERLAANSMTAYWSELKTKLETTERAGIWTLGKWHWAQVTAPNILRSGGWMTFSMSDKHVETTSNSSSSTKSFGVDLPIPKTPIALSGEHGSGSSSSGSTLDLSDFALSFELAEVPLYRPAIDMNFLLNDRWKLPTGAEPLSDGGSPPKGSLVAVPTFIILVRNLKLRFRELGSTNSRTREHLRQKGGLKFLGLNIGASASRGTSSARSEYTFDETKGEISVGGAQIIGYRNQVMPAAPNPDPRIKDWVAAGGQS